MTMLAVWGLCVCACVLGVQAASTSRPMTSYDQRQQGELNIHAQLENVVVVLIPVSSASLNLLQLADLKGGHSDKGGFLQQLMHGVKDQENSVDTQNDPDTPVILSQPVSFYNDINKNIEKEEEVAAIVEELKPETTEKMPETSTSSVVDDSSLKKQEIINVVEIENAPVVNVEKKEGLESNSATEEKKAPAKEIETGKLSETEQTLGPNEKSDLGPNKDLEKQDIHKEEIIPEKGDESPVKDQQTVEAEAPQSGPTLKDLIRPIASKSESKKEEDGTSKKKTHEDASEGKRLVEGVRKEKVIRYKPDSKWAPGLMDLLGTPKSRELEERQRFSGLCSPGVWDSELKTCIMPGETRSRKELARFLEAMRFGIAIPSQ